MLLLGVYESLRCDCCDGCSFVDGVDTPLMLSGNGTSTKVIPRCLFLRVRIFLRFDEEYVEVDCDEG